MHTKTASGILFYYTMIWYLRIGVENIVLFSLSLFFLLIPHVSRAVMELIKILNVGRRGTC